MSGSPKLIADAMLGSLARKLRIFGFDTLYFREGPDSELLRLAKAQGRAVLTSDRELVARARKVGMTVLMVTGRTERERMTSLEEQARSVSLTLAPGPTRCALCNTPLLPLKRRDVDGEIPSAVSSRHRAYYRCADCRKLYWKGRHWKRLKTLSSFLSRA